MTTFYVTIMEDNRTETEVALFTDRELALRTARAAARYQRMAELNIHATVDRRLLFWATGGPHEATLRVVEREVVL